MSIDNQAQNGANDEGDNLSDFDLRDIDEIGDNHVSTCVETPMIDDAHRISDEEKIERISQNVRQIMATLGLDLNDDSLNGTPRRVAKMYVEEVFSGLNPKNKPEVRLFENTYGYNEMLVEKDISVYSYCEHHLVPIVGRAHVAYIPQNKVIGLSKINRMVRYYARRPQVQERLTMQVAREFRDLLDTEDVAVIIDAHHMCVSSRGIEDTKSSTVTAKFYGRFKNLETRSELLRYIGANNQAH